MRCSFFTSLLLFTLYKKIHAFTPVNCLQNLSNLNELETQFTGTGNVYCAYINNNSIKEVTFNVKNTNIKDWDITVGNWDSQSTFVDIQNPTVYSDTSKNNYKISLEDFNVNAIVWVLNNGENGEITNVELMKDSSKRYEDSCEAFSQGFIWKDISWDLNNEKSFNEKNSIINLNNTLYLNTLSLLFKKKNSNGSNDYFTGGYTIGFNMKSDSPEWMVYAGEYDEETSEVTICNEWSIEELKPNISVNIETPVNLPNTKGESCNNNIIWFQNVKNDQNSQRIWISKLVVKNCGNKDD